jgi:predicted acylesterase/phospholipase RssA
VKEEEEMQSTSSVQYAQKKSASFETNPLLPTEELPQLFKNQHNHMIHIRQAPKIENLVLSGGGVRGLIDIGAIKALEKYGLLSSISKIAGTSVGALIGAAVSFGMNSQQIESLMESLNFKSLLGAKTGGFIKRDGLPLLHFVDAFIKDAIHDYFSRNKDPEKIRKCHSILNKLTDDLEITFHDLKILRETDPSVFKKLYIKSYCIEKKMSVTFESTTSPNLGIATACRASASLPVELKHTKIQSDLLNHLFELDDGMEFYSFADGGINDNIPTDIFESDPDKVAGEFDQNLKTLAFVFDESLDSREKSFFDTMHVNSKKIMHMGKVKRAIANVAIRLDGIKLQEKYTKSKIEGLDNVRQRYPLLSVPFKTHQIKANDYTKAQTQFYEMINTGYETASAHIKDYLGTDLISYYYKKFENLESFFLSADDDEVSSIFYNLEQYEKIFPPEEMKKLRSPHFRQVLFHFKDDIKQEIGRYFSLHQDEIEKKDADKIKSCLVHFLRKLNSFEPTIDIQMKKNLFDFMLKKLQQKIFRYDAGDGSKTIIYLLNQKIYETYHHRPSKHTLHGIFKIVTCIQSVWNELDPEKNRLALEKIISIAQKSSIHSESSLIYDALMKYDPENKIEFFRLFYFIK